MVSTEKVCRSGHCIYSIYFLLVIISRNHCNTFLLINLKKKNFSKVKYWRKDCFFWYQNFDRFGEVFVHYISVQIIVLNLLYNKYPERNKDFSPPQARGIFCILRCNFGYKQYFLWKAVCNGWVKCGYNLNIMWKNLTSMN